MVTFKSGGPALARRDLPVREQDGAAYTLSLADNGGWLRFTEDIDPVVVTVPAEADVPFPIGARVHLEQADAQEVSVAGDCGVTVLIPAGANPNTEVQHAVMHLVKVDADTWLLYGNLEEAIL
jgi:hypothetical protein